MKHIAKKVFQIVLGLSIGIAAGLTIAGMIIVCFTDTSFPEFIDKFKSITVGESIKAFLIGIIAFIVSLILLVTIHETGHLVCGLLSGYKFVSFRLFNLTFIRLNGKIHIKKYAIAGTGGQCLLLPPELPLDRIPTGWYNFGGVFFNILAMIIVAPLMLIKGYPLLSESVAIFLFTDLMLIIMNGIPLKISGAGNDGYNMIALRKNPLAKRGLVVALRSNALIQEGIRPKDMPDNLFIIPEHINYRDQLEVSIPIMAASRLIDEMRFYDALAEFEGLYNHRNEIIPLYVNETSCELVFLRLIGDDKDGALELLDEKLKKYIQAFRKVMSSKERILCAIALKINNDRDKAISIYENLLDKEKEYLLRGEVKSDLAIMQKILGIC